MMKNKPQITLKFSFVQSQFSKQQENIQPNFLIKYTYMSVKYYDDAKTNKQTNKQINKQKTLNM